MISKLSYFFIENILRIFCIRKYQKKENFKKAGYIVDKPPNYNSNNYSKITRSWWDVTVYNKYGKRYSVEDINKMYNLNINKSNKNKGKKNNRKKNN